VISKSVFGNQMVFTDYRILITAYGKKGLAQVASLFFIGGGGYGRIFPRMVGL
jgi:hypothetical protein